MRVIAGRFRSRHLHTIPGLAVRPTPDRLRESLFSILAPLLPEAIFLDAYAGTGSVGIEALSRGAARAVFIENNPTALETLRRNLASLDLPPDQALILRGSAPALLSRSQPALESLSVAFLDPPYSSTAGYPATLAALAATSCTLAIAQHPKTLALDEQYGALIRSRVLTQGDNSLSFYSREL